MTGTIRVTPQELKNASSQFGSADSNVQNITRSMMAIVDALSGSWSGEAATGYYNKLKGLEGDMNKLHSMINEHVKDLAQMASVYEAAETANVSAASALKTNQIV